ncbi:MAG: hypothetical protein JO095_11620 [Alphaproteobacteria bacterium]|nr:hypothetical protein [Alphaproteobacteria bacterium]
MSSSQLVIEHLRALAAPRRNNYFYGKRLDVPHFRMEQDYGKEKQWLLNRLSLGKGVLCGLDVTAKHGQVCVAPGVAIDGLGREIVVPLPTCIDPWAPPPLCCGEDPQLPPVDRNATRVVTLWLCYRECLADMMPVLVAECDIRQECAPGTIVETFALKITDGLPPELGDPMWSNALHPAPTPRPTPSPSASPSPTPSPTPSPSPTAPPGFTGLSVFTRPGALTSWPAPHQMSERELLCSLLENDCCPPAGDPCVPIAALLLQGGEIAQLETCRYRPRIYSNAVLLDLILCLMLRIEDCCGHPVPTPSPTPRPTPTPTATPTPSPPPTPTPIPSLGSTLRVRGVSLINAAGASLQSLNELGGAMQLSRRQAASVIRVNFVGALDPRTVVAGVPARGDDPNKFTFLVERKGSAYPQDVVPGTITGTNAAQAQFQFIDGPFPAGEYLVTLAGTPDAAIGRPAILAMNGSALDGEPTQLPSGNGAPGGNFVFSFIIG